MIVSLNEVEAMVWKASRGAGLAWGLAEETAQAARWLADRGLDWAAPVVACLEAAERDGVPAPLQAGDTWQQPAGDLSPTLCGPLISDLAPLLLRDGRAAHFGPMAHPVLLLPFVSRAAQDLGAGFTISWPGARFSCAGPDVWTIPPAAFPPKVTRVELGVNLDPKQDLQSPIPAGAERRAVPSDLLRRLEGWVRRTYVPASAESRLAGAGAGLTDND